MHQKYVALILCTPVLGATAKYYQQALEKSVSLLRKKNSKIAKKHYKWTSRITFLISGIFKCILRASFEVQLIFLMYSRPTLNYYYSGFLIVKGLRDPIS